MENQNDALNRLKLAVIEQAEALEHGGAALKQADGHVGKAIRLARDAGISETEIEAVRTDGHGWGYPMHAKISPKYYHLRIKSMENGRYKKLGKIPHYLTWGDRDEALQAAQVFANASGRKVAVYRGRGRWRGVAPY